VIKAIKVIQAQPDLRVLREFKAQKVILELTEPQAQPDLRVLREFKA